MKIFPLLLLLLACCTCNITLAQSKKPVPVIFDTDMGPDYDDVGAIAMLHALADSGEATILATMASTKHVRVAATLDVFNTYFNRPNVPVGVPKGQALDIGAWQKWDSLVIANYPHSIQSNEEAENAIALYRRLLAAQPDGSVTIITVGFLTNLANLLHSPADQHSPLRGAALVKKKVKQLVCMAGRFPSGKEFNVDRDIPASKIVFTEWPGPIVFSGFEVGVEILSGLPLIKNNAIQKSPVKDAFARSIPMSKQDSNGRMSWDETAVLIGIRGWDKYYTVQPGRFVIQEDGSNAWDSSGKEHFYVVRKMPVAEVTALINQLIMHQPVERR